MSEEQKPAGHDDWKVDDAVGTLLRAEEIKQDKELMAKVHKKLGDKKKAIMSLSDLKKASAELDREEDGEDEEDAEDDE